MEVIEALPEIISEGNSGMVVKETTPDAEILLSSVLSPSSSCHKDLEDKPEDDVNESVLKEKPKDESTPEAASQTLPNEKNKNKSALEEVKGTAVTSVNIPPTKKNKKTLNELHQQLLKKLDPSLIPSDSPSLSDIFKNETRKEVTENNKPKEQTDKDVKGVLGADSSSAAVGETPNGPAKNISGVPDGRPSEKGLYRCSIDNCNCSFNRVNDLKTHTIEAHPSSDSFPCSFCFDEFDSIEKMTEHLKDHIKNVFKCSHCQMASDTKDELLNHVSTDHPGQPKKITIYVKILNNDRQKKAVVQTKASSDVDHSISRPPSCEVPPSVGKASEVSSKSSHEKTGTENGGSAVKMPNAEVTKSRSSRKSAKPTKFQKDPSEDVVRIFPAERNMNVICDRCSFTCDSQFHMKNHQVEGHTSPTGTGLFKCKVCKFSTDVKSCFQQHMVRHTGRHVIRYYICPYCDTDTNSMDLVEEHVGDKHPSEAFRFEVLQETIEFLHDLLECPVCRGSFLWRDEFVQHVKSVHRLDDLAGHLNENFSGVSLTNQLVPKALFRNLLPEMADFEELPPEQTIVSSDEESQRVVGESHGQNLDRLGDATSICVQQSGFGDGDQVFQFNCQTCNYSSCDYEQYMDHFKSHVSEKPESLIKKLLTKSTGASPLEQNNGSDVDFDADRLPPSPAASGSAGTVKVRGSYQCHLCPFQCTKTVHFKRHLAIHARNETLKEGYKCGYCQFAHYRLNCVKFHLGKYHGNYPNKMIRIMDGVEIELGADDDPGKVKRTPSNPPTLSPGLYLRTASEKRPTMRYKDSLMPSLQRSSAPAPRNSEVDSSHEISLTEFELSLPSMMIYPEAVKCPRCDFSNRVRINLIRHLKLHREETEPSGLILESPSSTFMRESIELRSLGSEDMAAMSSTAKADAGSGVTDRRRVVLDEKPLLRSILSEKPTAARLGLGDEEADNRSNSGSAMSEDRESGSTSQTLDHSAFSVRVPNSNLYRCKECPFVHRFPSKVKRHYSYKHISVFPYKCGYCNFQAVEGGKVKRHCHQMHRGKPERMIKCSTHTSGAKSKNHAANSAAEVSPKERDDVTILDETISGEGGDGQGDGWLAQFVIRVDSNRQCCKLCGYQQEKTSALKRHVYAKHLKFYPFSCKYCGVALMEIYRVKKHIEKYHAGLPFIVVRRHFEDPTSESISNLGMTSRALLPAEGDSVKAEPEDVDEEAPQLDFYPKCDDPDLLFAEAAIQADAGDLCNGSEDMTTLARDRVGMEAEEAETFDGGNVRRMFKCVYCNIISKWNRRDIRLHIMHVHLKRRVYTCRHCSFGNSKSKAIVKGHCAKFHPNKSISVRDDLPLFNSIVPIEDKNGIVTMAFANSNGVPVLDVEELDNLDNGKKTQSKSESAKIQTIEFGLQVKVEEDEFQKHKRTDRNAKHITSTSSSKKLESPIDLSAKTVSDSSIRTPMKSPQQPATLGKSESGGKERTEYRCKLCGFINQNVSHVKYHLICYHMKLKPFSCPYCHMYIWKSQGVVNHIRKHHPGREVKICATVEEKSAYLSSSIEKVSESSVIPKDMVVKKPVKPAVPVATVSNENAASTGSSQKLGYFRCGICGYQDARNDKTKYHIIKQHLKLRQFSCPHCHLYMWGRQQVAKHIEEEHPGMEISITRTFQEYEEFLKQTITRVAGPSCDEVSEEEFEEDTETVSAFCRSTNSSPPASLLRLRCNKCSFVTDSEMSLSAHKRSHRMFQCFHCDFRHMLAAKVQIHCLAKHPNKLVKYQQCDTSVVEPTSERAASKTTHASAGSAQSNNPTSERKGGKVFHPCDTCPAHFDTVLELEKHVLAEHQGMYICSYCHIVLWNSTQMNEHLGQSHPDKRPDFKLIKKEPNDSGGGDGTRKRRSTSRREADESEGLSAKMLKLEQLDEVVRKPEKATVANERNSGSNDLLAVYKCRLCKYRSGKVTVMRHHAMSHLRYHPYLCPYCDLVRSVKSFPITKHIRSKHPDREAKFLYVRDEAMEAQVKNGYHKVHVQSKASDSTEAEETMAEEESKEEPKSSATYASGSSSSLQSMLPRKVLYKCTFCGLKTHIRTDMKHHLMREIHYKPFRCVFCTYTEPCRWSMRKHFRTKHAGVEVEVEDLRDPESDTKVDKLLEECTVLLKNSVDPELLSWQPSSTPQRRVSSFSSAPKVVSKPKLSSASGFGHKPTSFGTSMLKRPFKSGKSMAIKFHRCPHCAYTNTSLKLVRGHMVKHGPFRLQCGYCDYRGHYPSRIRKHMRKHHPSLPFKCTKVTLPPKDHKTEDIPVIHVPRGQVKAQNKPAPGTVFLDGVPVNITLNPDSDGVYRCVQCDYQSVNREHFKMHVVIHRPPKWKCFYCDQKYPVIFRLRRHSNAKHPNLPIKWVEVETGLVSTDTLKPTSASSKSSPKSRSAPQGTARKSTSKGLRVALFRSKYSQKSLENLFSESPSCESDSTIVEDKTPFVIGEPYSLVDESDSDMSDSDADISMEMDSSPAKLCCHLCPFSTYDWANFAHHLETSHVDFKHNVTVEALPHDGSFTLRRCGFCVFETHDSDEYDMHVRLHTDREPVQCEHCGFASFDRRTVVEHSHDQHPHLETRVRQLREPYTMSRCSSEQWSPVLFNAVVLLEDIMQISDIEFKSVLASHGVTFQN